MATAIVTGGAARLGKAMACHLAARGFHIALHYNTTSPEETKTRIECHGVQCRVYARDFTDLAQAETLIEEIVKDFADVELLVNSAANFVQENIESTQTRTLRETMDINFLAPYLLMREYKRRVGRGLIVNVLDQRILKNIPTFAAYSAAKTALAHLTHQAAVEWGETVRVNGIAPGLILPPPGGPADYTRREAKKIPTRTHGTERDIVKGLDYLIDNKFVNGEILFIDGGESKTTANTTL